MTRYFPNGTTRGLGRARARSPPPPARTSPPAEINIPQPHRQTARKTTHLQEARFFTVKDEPIRRHALCRTRLKMNKNDALRTGAPGEGGFPPSLRHNVHLCGVPLGIYEFAGNMTVDPSCSWPGKLSVFIMCECVGDRKVGAVVVKRRDEQYK